MKKEEALRIFETACLIPELKKALNQVEMAFQSGKSAFKLRFLEVFDRACKSWGREPGDDSCAYITAELLRLRLGAGDYRYRIMMYHRNWYLEEGKHAEDLDAAVILSVYREFENRIKEESNRYIGKISQMEAEALARRMLPFFHEYVKEMILYSVSAATELESFRLMKKADGFQLRVGECMEPGFLVFMDRGKEALAQLTKRLDGNRKEACCFQDFRGLSLEGAGLSSGDFCNADFRDAELKFADFSFSLLTGARFQRSRLCGAAFTGSLLHGADFTGADLSNASLRQVQMYDGKTGNAIHRLAGYPEGHFTDADLNGTDFRGAVFCGTDFRGAILTGADFREACLYRCLFNRNQLVQTELTQEQRGQLLLEG